MISDEDNQSLHQILKLPFWQQEQRKLRESSYHNKECVWYISFINWLDACDIRLLHLFMVQNYVTIINFEKT